MSFRLEAYEQLLQTLGAAPDRMLWTVTGFAKALRTGEEFDRAVVLRHDVDRRPARAVQMARLEAAWGVRASYYFRCDRHGRFPESAIRQIGLLGHEVGYHYECLSRCNGAREAALAQFRHHIEAFRRISPCTSVAMHGAPLSRHRNQDLLVGKDLATYGLVADAVLTFDHLRLAYLTDTGGKWQASAASNMRDRVGRHAGQHPSPGDDAFASWLSGFPHPVYISTHPERWPRSRAGFVEAMLRDVLANQAKRALGRMRAKPALRWE